MSNKLIYKAYSGCLREMLREQSECNLNSDRVKSAYIRVEQLLIAKMGVFALKKIDRCLRDNFTHAWGDTIEYQHEQNLQDRLGSSFWNMGVV